MPRYDYKCKHCKKTVEINKSIKDYDREELCPLCDFRMERKFNKEYSVDVKTTGFYGKKGGF